MMLMPEAPAPGRMPGCGIHEEYVARAHFDRQRAPVQPPLERLQLERHTVVVDAVAPVDARPAQPRRPVESKPRPDVVQILPARALQERLDQRVDVGDAADVLDIGIELVPHAEIERQAVGQSQIVLDESM